MTIKVATVFSGIGAIEQALKRLNYEHEVAFACDNGNIEIDIDADYELDKIRKMDLIQDKKKYANDLYKMKSKKTNFVEKSYLANYKIKEDNFFYDIKLLDGRPFRDQIDLYVGGSPCQSFSIIGRKAGLEDARGTLFYDYVRVLNEIQPRVFIYENVFGLYKHDKGRTWEIIQQIFDSLNYHYKYQVLDARDFGIPQGRRRIFVVGFKSKDDYDQFSFPNAKKLNIKMQDMLLDNVKYGSMLSKDKILNISRDGGQKVDEKYYLSEKLLKYCLSAGTKNFYHADAKIDLPIARALLSTMGNHHRSSVNNYVTTNNRIRSLTIEEAHRLMGFPDDYKIVVSKAQAYKQAGNSIVVDVLMAIMEEINKVTRWNYGKN